MGILSAINIKTTSPFFLSELKNKIKVDQSLFSLQMPSAIIARGQQSLISDNNLSPHKA